VRKAFVILFLGILLFGIGAVFCAESIVSASSGSQPISTFEIDLYGPPPPVVSIQVPDRVDLGNISYGDDLGEDVKVDINNTGNVMVNVKPVLVDTGNEIYSGLYFRRITSDPYVRIGEWSMNISAPTSGGVKESYFYVRLDLRDYSGTIDRDMINEQADIKFIATQAQ
jgi:hypothetical protein